MDREKCDRVDYGTTYKYRGLNGRNLLFPGRCQALRLNDKPGDFSLLHLNPHKDALGLNPKDFTASRLFPGATAGALHADQALQQPDLPLDNGSDSGTDQEHDVSTHSEDGAPRAHAAGAAAAAAQDDTGPPAQAADLGNGLNAGPQQQPQRQRRRRRLQDADDAGPSVSEDADDSYDRNSDSSRSRSHRGSSDDDGDSDISSDSHSRGEAAAQQQVADSSESDMDISDEEDDAADSEETDGFIPLLGDDAGDGAAAGDGQPGQQLQQQQEQRTVGYQPPWLSTVSSLNSPMLRLHNEIVAFTAMLEPTAEEVESRKGSLAKLREVVASIWPNATVEAFGSYETGLYTPASDTDVVVMNTGVVGAQTGLKALASALQSRQLVRNMQLILTARVPIIKFEMIDSGLAFDVSWEIPSGPQGAQVVKGMLEKWPALRPLALVLKVFLTQRELNEVYQGGIGSYTLIIMITSFLQLHASRRAVTGSKDKDSSKKSGKRRRSEAKEEQRAQPLDANLGLLLVDFMRLYGRVLNTTKVGISCTNDGSFYDKSRKNFVGRDKPYFLSVQDPIDPSNDTSRGSYNIKAVRLVFDHAYQLLTTPCSSGESLLGRIIHLSPVINGRRAPFWCIAEQQHQHQQHSGNGNRRRRRSRSRSPRRDRDRDRREGRDGRRDRRGRSSSRQPGRSSSDKRERSSSRQQRSSRTDSKRSRREDSRGRDDRDEQHRSDSKQRRPSRRQRQKLKQQQQQNLGQELQTPDKQRQGGQDRQRQQQQPGGSPAGTRSSGRNGRGMSADDGGSDGSNRYRGYGGAGSESGGEHWHKNKKRRM